MKKRRVIKIYFPRDQLWIVERLEQLARERYKGSFQRAFWAVVERGVRVAETRRP